MATTSRGRHDMDILLAIIKSVACPKCFEVGSLTLVQNAKYGLAFKNFFCNNCKDWKNEFTTSTKTCKKFDIKPQNCVCYDTLWKGLSRSS